MFSLMTPELKETSIAEVFKTSAISLAKGKQEFFSYCDVLLTEQYMISSIDKIVALSLSDNIITAVLSTNLGQVGIIIQKSHDRIILKLQPPGLEQYSKVAEEVIVVSE